MTTRYTRYSIIGRGFNGWHARGVTDEGIGECRCSVRGCYDDAPRYVREAVEGAPVYDAAHLEGTPHGAAFEDWVYSPDALSEDPAALVASLRAKVPGVRFGTVTGRRIVWEPDAAP